MIGDLIGTGQPQGAQVVLTPQQQQAKLADALLASGANQGKTAQTPMGALGSVAQSASGTWMKNQPPQTTLGPWQTAVEGGGGWQTSVQPDPSASGGGFWNFLGL